MMADNTLAMTELGKGETVVLLHGWGMNSQIFAALSDALSKKYHVIVIDLPGHGASDAVCPLTLDDVAAQLLTQVEGRCHWLGWSLGGAILMRMAQLAPAHFRSLTLIAANPCFINKENWSDGIDAGILNDFAQALTRQPEKTLKRFAALQVLHSHHGNMSLKQINELALSAKLPDLQSLQQGLQCLLEEDLRPVLENLQVPMLILLGECDALVPVSIEDYYRQLSTKPQVHIIAGAGHAPFLPDASATAGLIDSFLQQQHEKVQAYD